MFSSMMPHRREFYDLLIAHTERIVAASNAALRLVNTLGLNSSEVDALIKEVDMNETSGDKIKAELVALLNKSFITPISRDAIHTLTLELDKILDTLEDVANAVVMYNIKESTPEVRELAALGSDACLRLNRAMIALSEKEHHKDAMGYCQEIDEIETKADKVLKKAVTRLFRDGGDVWEAMRLRELYFLQENVLDYCEEAAKTIEEILIENA
jgi:hypothetical protein